jgi:site-specific DNA-methyltransferase (adenine-specific)
MTEDNITTNVQLENGSPAFAKPVLGAVPSVVYNEDCVEGLKRFSDNYFDVAIVDPPYGIEDKISIGGGSHTKSKSKFHQRYKENGKTWDKRPTIEFWEQLFRVSKNQIVCGANYFTEYLPVSRGWAYWHKQGEKMSSVNDELIWTSFDVSIKKFSRCHGMDKGFLADHKVFHPTTKPVALYDWLIFSYCDDANLILDTHVGSGSSRIATAKASKQFTGFEIDKDYYEAQEKRFKDFVSQLRMF